MKTFKEYYRIAAEFYLSNELPEDFDHEKGEFNVLQELAWEPFEEYDGGMINQLILNLAEKFRQIANEASKTD